MRVLRIEGPNRIALGDAPVPDVGDEDVLIDVLAGGICGTDVEILQGDMIYFTSGLASYPVIPCHEWTGIVRDLGRNVTHLEVGDHVVGEVSIGCLACETCKSGNYHRCARRTETGIMNRDGGFAERILLPGAFVHPISRSVPLRSAALVEPSAIAYNGVLKAGITPGTSVAIFGDGPIGLLILQIVRLFGARRVTLIGASDARLQAARRLGADAVIDARAGDVPSLLAAGGEKLPGVTFEASGNAEAIRSAVAATAPGGRIVLQGFCGARPVEKFSVDPVIVNDLTLVGAIGSPGVWPDVIRLIEGGKLDPSAIVSDELPVSAFAEAIRRVQAREALKVVLRTSRPSDWQ